MIARDYVYLDVPMKLSRKASMCLPDGTWVPDLEFPVRMARIAHTQVSFFLRNGLLVGEWNLEEWRTWSLKFSDFTEEGQRFLMADYPGKWLGTLDRNINRDVIDVSYLDRRLRQMREKDRQAAG